MNKIKILTLSIVFSVFLAGCSMQKTRTIGEKTEIPESGIISTEVLKDIIDKGLVTVFYSKCGDVKYEWTVFGSELESDEPVNLLSDISVNESNEIEILFSGDDKPFSPVISIHTGKDLREYHYEIFETENGKEYSKGYASVSGEGDSVITFKPGKLCGKFVLKPEKSAENKSVTEKAYIKNEHSKLSAVSVTTMPAVSETVLPESASSADVTQKTDPFYNDSSDAAENTVKITDQPDNNVPDDELKCTMLIECTTVFSNLSSLEDGKINIIPSDGIILSQQEISFCKGDTVFDVLKKYCTDNKIHFEYEWTPMYNSSYVSGINNLYEFDCGSLSGWLYSVNGWYPNYGPGCYELRENDVIEWRFSCDLGKDINGGIAVNQKDQ